MKNVLARQLEWTSETITVFGKSHLIPRLQAFYGDPGLSYRYSSKTFDTLTWHPALVDLRDTLEDKLKQRFNCVLCNYYRDGDDHMGWHSDNEPELGPNPCIASLSFGEIRTFKFRFKSDHSVQHEYQLEHNSLIVMKNQTQHYWEHSLPKRKKARDLRINLTFRNIVSP